MIECLPDLHKFLKGKLQNEGNNDSVKIKMSISNFNKETFSVFLKRVSSIPSHVKNMEFVLQDIDLHSNVANVDSNQFEQLRHFHTGFEKVKIVISNTIWTEKYMNMDIFASLMQIGLHWSREMKSLRNLEISLKKTFKVSLNEGRAIIKIKEHFACELKYIKLCAEMKALISNWLSIYPLQMVEINWYFSARTYKKSEHDRVVEFLVYFTKQQELRSIKLKLSPELRLNRESFEYLSQNFVDFSRPSLKVVELILNDSNALFPNQMDMTSHISTRLTYVYLQMKGSCYFELRLRQKHLEISLLSSNRNEGQYIPDIFGASLTWDIENLETLSLNVSEIQDSNKCILLLLLIPRMRKLKELFIDCVLASPSLIHSIDLLKLSQVLVSLNSLVILKVYLAQANNVNSNLDQFSSALRQLDSLERVDLDFSKNNFTPQSLPTQQFRDNIQKMSQKLTHFSIKLPIQLIIYQPKNIYHPGSLHLILPFIISHINLSQFTASERNNQITLIEGRLIIILENENIREITHILLQFSKQTLQNINIRELDVHVKCLLSIDSTPINALFSNIHPQISKIQVRFNSPHNLSQHFDYEFSFGDFRGDFSLYLQDNVKVQKENNEINALFSLDDIKNNQERIKKQEYEEENQQEEQQNLEEGEIIIQNDLEQENKIIHQNGIQISEKYPKILRFLSQLDTKNSCSFQFAFLTDKQFLKEVVSKLPNTSEGLSLGFSHCELTNKDMYYLKEIFVHAHKNLKQFKIDISNNEGIHNRGCIQLFLKFHELKKSIQRIDIDLSYTSVRQKGILALSAKLCKFSQLREISLDFSHSKFRVYLKSDIFDPLFLAVSKNQNPYLDSFVLRASQTFLLMDQAFFDSLTQGFSKFPKKVKKLHLDFSFNSLIKVNLKPFRKCLLQISSHLTDCLFHFDSLSNYSEDFLIEMLRIPRVIKSITLQSMSIRLPDMYGNNPLSEKFLKQLLKTLQVVQQKDCKELKLITVNFEMNIKQNQLTYQCTNLLSSITNISPDKIRKFAFLFYDLLALQKPSNLIIPPQQLYFSQIDTQEFNL